MNINSKCYKYFVYRPIYFFRKEPVWRNLPALLKNCTKSSDEIISEQYILIRKQVKWCYNNIGFYQTRFDDAGFNVNIDWTLDDFSRNVPVLEKADVRNLFQEIDTKNSRIKLAKRQTSGSTGVPVIIYKDMEGLSYIDSAMHRNFLSYGIDIGDRRAHFWGGGSNWKDKARIYFRDLLTNWVRFDCFELSQFMIKKYHQRLNSFGPQYIYGYGKCIYEFVRFSNQLGIRPRFPSVKVVSLTGEKVTYSQKKIISAYFDAPVAEEYGCTECGVIAFECVEGALHTMADIIYVETVDDNNKQADPGTAGSIVLTELRGALLPLLRYRIGDIGTLSNRKCDCGLSFPIIENIQGRDDDYILCPDGTKIDAYCIEYSIKNVGDKLGVVKQVKGLQRTSTELEIMIVGDFNNAIQWRISFEKELHKYLKQIKIVVVFVDAIPKQSSGKLKFFESSIQNNQ